MSWETKYIRLKSTLTDLPNKWTNKPSFCHNRLTGCGAVGRPHMLCTIFNTFMRKNEQMASFRHVSMSTVSGCVSEWAAQRRKQAASQEEKERDASQLGPLKLSPPCQLRCAACLQDQLRPTKEKASSTTTQPWPVRHAPLSLPPSLLQIFTVNITSPLSQGIADSTLPKHI